MQELVSIVMPSYNCARFLEDSIKSVISQTYSNWELLIVDDCSTDDSLEIARKFATTDSRISVFRNKKNSGAAVSRNFAIKKAKGKWIAFLDADDLWSAEKLEKQINFMKKHNYSFSYTLYSEISEDGKDTGIYISGPKKVGKNLLYFFNFMGCLTVMYDAEKIGLIQIPDLKKRNDWALWLKVVKKAPCYLLNENLAQYRIRKSGSITHVKKGKISLVKYHYYLFTTSEEMNPVCAWLLSCVNVVAGVFKKIFYRKYSDK